jgi:hypothetical protein
LLTPSHPRDSFSLTTFSPSGKLVQIEHALAAVGQGTTSLGIKGEFRVAWMTGGWRGPFGTRGERLKGSARLRRTGMNTESSSACDVAELTRRL